MNIMWYKMGHAKCIVCPRYKDKTENVPHGKLEAETKS